MMCDYWNDEPEGIQSCDVVVYQLLGGAQAEGKSWGRFSTASTNDFLTVREFWSMFPMLAIWDEGEREREARGAAAPSGEYLKSRVRSVFGKRGGVREQISVCVHTPCSEQRPRNPHKHNERPARCYTRPASRRTTRRRPRYHPYTARHTTSPRTKNLPAKGGRFLKGYVNPARGYGLRTAGMY